MRQNIEEAVHVNSTAIVVAKYSYLSNKLTLTYVNESIYAYLNVENHVFKGLRDSKSKGKFINKYILSKYKFYKV